MSVHGVHPALVLLACAITALATRLVVLRSQARVVTSLVARIAGLRGKAPARRGGDPRDAFTGLRAELDVLEAALARHDRVRQESEEVLRLVVEQAPSAMVFLTAEGKILLANAQARDLFFDGQDLVGSNFLAMVSRAPEALKRAMVAEGDELISIDDPDGEPRTLHLGKRHLKLADAPVVLVTLHDLTRELGRREVEVWKQVIRVIAHEVNNSLAPIATVASTGRVVARGTEGEAMLSRVFDTVTERTAHLATFLEGYARFAKLPEPKRGSVPMRELADRMAALWPGIRAEGDMDHATGWFDRAQIEQLLLNLLKNAREAGSPSEAIALVFEASDRRFLRLVVRDRGQGMPPDVMKRALLPLFSTKAGGGGLGLALCREIAEAHGGTLRLNAREGGGLEVSVKLPWRSEEPHARLSPLTLTRGT
jgi:PAS domain S-box-containing protein